MVSVNKRKNNGKGKVVGVRDSYSQRKERRTSSFKKVSKPTISKRRKCSNKRKSRSKKVSVKSVKSAKSKKNAKSTSRVRTRNVGRKITKRAKVSSRTSRRSDNLESLATVGPAFARRLKFLGVCTKRQLKTVAKSSTRTAFNKWLKNEVCANKAQVKALNKYFNCDFIPKSAKIAVPESTQKSKVPNVSETSPKLLVNNAESAPKTSEITENTSESKPTAAVPT